MTVGIKGDEYDISSSLSSAHVDFYALAHQLSGQDVTSVFNRREETVSSCLGLELEGAYASSSLCGSNVTTRFCVLPPATSTTLGNLQVVKTGKYIGYTWTQVAQLPEYMVLNGLVLDLGPYLEANPEVIAGDEVDEIIRHVLSQGDSPTGKDATRLFYNSDRSTRAVQCISDRYRAGRIDNVAPGCFFASIMMYVVLVIVLGIIIIRFTMALVFSWWLAPRMSRAVSKGMTIEWGKEDGMNTVSKIGAELYTICLVTCYSEGRNEIRGTLEAITNTTYSDNRKLLFVVCDGIVMGHGEMETSAEICVSLLTRDRRFAEPKPLGYIAVGMGSKRENAAKVYAGHYHSTSGRKAPMIIVVKCGSESERESAEAQGKPGNRGKRDSQMILMNFIMRVNYNERFTPLDFDLFRKVYTLCGVHADVFEAVLMVS